MPMKKYNADLALASFFLFLLALQNPVVIFINNSFQIKFYYKMGEIFPLYIIFMTPFAIASSLVGLGLGLAGLFIQSRRQD